MRRVVSLCACGLCVFGLCQRVFVGGRVSVRGCTCLCVFVEGNNRVYGPFYFTHTLLGTQRDHAFAFWGAYVKHKPTLTLPKNSRHLCHKMPPWLFASVCVCVCVCVCACVRVCSMPPPTPSNKMKSTALQRAHRREAWFCRQSPRDILWHHQGPHACY